MPQVKLEFKEDGTVETDVNGIKGTQCTKLTDNLLAPLKPVLAEPRKLKQEYNEVAQTTQTQTRVNSSL